MKKHAIILLVFIFNYVGTVFNDDDSELFETNDLDCWYKPSCNLTQNSNSSLIPFLAGCKCDADCIKYEDCCKDSKYYGRPASPVGKEYTCHSKLEVFMVSSCPATYKNEAVLRNCSFELPIKDIAFVVPVTNKKTRTTYLNKYCARCHNETHYEPWDLVVDYFEISSTFFENEYANAAAESDDLFGVDYDDSTDQSSTSAEQNVDNAAQSARNRIPIEEFFPSLRFYPAQESFLFGYKGKQHICTFEPKLPAELAAYVRKCLPTLITECPDDGLVNEICKSYTEIVYERFNSLAFRNKDCAECNSVPADDTSFCAQNPTPAEPSIHGYAITGRNKTRNRKLCQNPILPRFFCPAARNIKSI